MPVAVRDMTTPGFDARQAATVIREIEGYEQGLRRRTEGIMWMIWSLVFAGIAMSYWTMGLLSPPGTPDAAEVLPDRGLVTPWIGWVVAGGLATMAVWRSAALKREGETRGDAGLRHMASLAAIMVGTWLLFIASWALPASIAQYLYAGGPLVILGLSTLIVVSTPLMRLTTQGRRVARAAAIAQVAIALLYALLLEWGAASPAVPAELLAALVVGGSWLAAGLWQSSQG